MGAVLLLGGCAVGGGGEEDEFGLADDKAVAAQPLTVDAGGGTAATTTAAVPGQAGGPTTTGRGGTTTTTSVRSVGGGGGGATTTTARGIAPYATRADVVDRTGDTEGTSVQTPPAYGDLVRLRLEDNGTQARVTVEMAADMPTRLREEEQVAVGIDLFRDTGTESEYQLYVRGDADGWRAWLQTPSGFVEYPGTFQVGANRLVHTVPWSALGGRRPGSLRVFAEWEFARVAVADERKDFVPDRGRQSFSF